MIHYTCDRCKNVIEDNQLRYKVNIEIEATLDNHDESDAKVDLDHLGQIDEILEDADVHELEELTDQIYQKKHYDLCCECFNIYAKNPLAVELPVSLGFSKN